MKKASILFLFFTLFFEVIYARESQWIKSWLIAGPFISGEKNIVSYDFLKSKGGEANPLLKKGDIIDYPGGTGKVISYNSSDSLIRINNSSESPSVWYAWSEVKSTESKLCFLAFDLRESSGIWFNGEKVADQKAQNSNLMIPVNMKKGKNTILIRIRKKNDLHFSVKMQSFSSNKLISRGDLFRISLSSDNEPQLSSDYSNAILRQIVQRMNVEVFDNLNRTVFKSQLNEDFFTKLSFPAKDFRPYQAKISVQLKNGEVINQSLYFSAGNRREYSLFSDHTTKYRIVMDSNASESERWAAQELQHWLGEISGAWFPVQTFNQKKHKGPQIVIGFNEYVKAKTKTEAPENSDESFTYCNSGPDIMIYGGKQRGTMYGVMSFLENEFGCRFYTPSVSVIPKRQEHNFYFYDHSEKPGIRVRNDFYFEAFDPIWAARNKMNGRMDYTNQPGGVEAYWSVHTFFKLLPPDEFFNSHPEYFSLVEGKRISERGQLCLTNPDVFRILLERIKERMRENPEYLIYDVSQNDWRNPCQCDNCQRIVKEEGSESGPVIWLVNKIAESVEKEFPGKFIGTLAYQYTRKPPKNIKPRQNVVVRLCPIEACVSHSLEVCPQNQSFINDLTGWSKIAPHLYIWDYVVNFAHYIMPYPNFNVLQPNIKTFQKNNAIGIMEQAAYQSRGGEFAEMKAYLISKLLWNPDCNAEAVINDFIYGYYGRSGQYILRYFDLLNSRITPETHMHIHLGPYDQLFSEEMIAQSCQLFDQALKEADNEEIMRRVEMSYLPILYLKCKRNPVVARCDGTYERFSNIAKREGITHYAEYKEAIADFNKMMENAR